MYIEKKKTRIKVVFLLLFCFFMQGSVLNINASINKNANDVIAVKSIIQTLQNNGAHVQADIYNKSYYKWSNKSGRLIEIHWKGQNIKGEVDLNQLSALRKVNVSNNNIRSLKVNKLQNLKELECSNNNLKDLEINQLNDLTYLDCENNRIESIKINALKLLKQENLQKLN